MLIDAEHTYEALRKDTLSCWKHLKDNGFAIFHDYGLFPGVTEFLDTLSNMYDGFYAQNEHLVVIKKNLTVYIRFTLCYNGFKGALNDYY